MLACTIILNYIVSTFIQALACAELREFTTTQLIMWLACGDAFASTCDLFLDEYCIWNSPLTYFSCKVDLSLSPLSDISTGSWCCAEGSYFSCHWLWILHVCWLVIDSMQLQKLANSKTLSAWECGGYFLFKSTSEFDQATEEAMLKKLSDVSLDDEGFQVVKQLCRSIADKFSGWILGPLMNVGHDRTFNLCRIWETLMNVLQICLKHTFFFF